MFITCGLLLAVGLFLLVVPTLDGPHSRHLRNEAATVGKLRTVLDLENQYRDAHPNSGFECELPLLKPTAQLNESEYDPFAFLVTGTMSGYRFSLVDCGLDASLPRTHYQLTAVPVQQGVTGLRAFCADESGLIWYDKTGSATKCLASRHALD
jgi:hypothetical protein